MSNEKPWALRPFESDRGHLIVRDVAEMREHHGYVSPEIEALVTRGTPITLAEYEALRANSYERCLMLSRLDDEALVSVTEHALRNASCHRCEVPATYDESLVCYLTPLLLERLHTLAQLQHQALDVATAIEALQEKVTDRIEKMQATVLLLQRTLDQERADALVKAHLPSEIPASVGIIEGWAGPKCVIIGTTKALEAVGAYLDAHNDPEAKRTGTAGRWWRQAEDVSHAQRILQMGGICLGHYETLGGGVDFSKLAQVGILVYLEGEAPADEILVQAAGRFNRIGGTARLYRVAIRP